MMNKVGFAHFMAKPKNGSMQADKAFAMFWELYNGGEVITDTNGVNKDLRERVAYKTKDLITHRNLDSVGNTTRVKKDCIKKATDEQARRQSMICRSVWNLMLFRGRIKRATWLVREEMAVAEFRQPIARS